MPRHSSEQHIPPDSRVGLRVLASMGSIGDCYDCIIESLWSRLQVRAPRPVDASAVLTPISGTAQRTLLVPKPAFCGIRFEVLTTR